MCWVDRARYGVVRAASGLAQKARDVLCEMVSDRPARRVGQKASRSSFPSFFLFGARGEMTHVTLGLTVFVFRRSRRNSEPMPWPAPASAYWVVLLKSLFRSTSFAGRYILSWRYRQKAARSMGACWRIVAGLSPGTIVSFREAPEVCLSLGNVVIVKPSLSRTCLGYSLDCFSGRHCIPYHHVTPALLSSANMVMYTRNTHALFRMLFTISSFRRMHTSRPACTCSSHETHIFS